MPEPTMISINVNWLDQESIDYIIMDYRHANELGYITMDDMQSVINPLIIRSKILDERDSL